MKKIYFISVLLLLTVVSFSQQNSKIRFGIYTGVNISNVSVKMNGLSVSPGYLLGSNTGLSAQIPIAANIYLQPELGVSQLGEKFNVSYSTMGQLFPGSTDSSSYTIKSVLNYLIVPVLIKYKAPNSGLGIYAGPQYGYLLSAKDTYKNNSQSTSNNSKADYNSSDFSAIIGAEYFSRSGLGASFRYQYGFSNTQKGATNGETVKNFGFTITLGYRF